MKNQKSVKKLSINKKTVAHLQEKELTSIRGGTGTYSDHVECRTEVAQYCETLTCDPCTDTNQGCLPPRPTETCVSFCLICW